jgi:hypothetical protein
MHLIVLPKTLIHFFVICLFWPLLFSARYESLLGKLTRDTSEFTAEQVHGFKSKAILDFCVDSSGDLALSMLYFLILL